MNRGKKLCKVKIHTKYWNKNNGHLVNEFQKRKEHVCKEIIGVIYVFHTKFILILANYPRGPSYLSSNMI
jgi:hypothetical protein